MSDISKMDSTPKETVVEMLARVDGERRAAVGSRVNAMPVTLRRAYLRCVLGESGSRAAIRAFCFECVGWERAEVSRCTSVACPLYLLRPKG